MSTGWLMLELYSSRSSEAWGVCGEFGKRNNLQQFLMCLWTYERMMAKWETTIEWRRTVVWELSTWINWREKKTFRGGISGEMERGCSTDAAIEGTPLEDFYRDFLRFGCLRVRTSMLLSLPSTLPFTNLLQRDSEGQVWCTRTIDHLCSIWQNTSKSWTSANVLTLILINQKIFL